MVKVWSNFSQRFIPILGECDLFYIIKDVDGLNSFILKDGNEIVKEEGEETNDNQNICN